MAKDGRTVFYAFGAALGLLLDQEGIRWQDRYLAEKFLLERYRTPRRETATDAGGAARRSSSRPGFTRASGARYRGMSYRLTFS
jgi:hypothetical protein